MDGDAVKDCELVLGLLLCRSWLRRRDLGLDCPVDDTDRGFGPTGPAMTGGYIRYIVNIRRLLNVGLPPPTEKVSVSLPQTHVASLCPQLWSGRPGLRTSIRTLSV